MTDICVDYVSGKQFRGEGSSEFPTVIDAPTTFGGEGLGASPMELMLMSIASCSGMDIVSILEKRRIHFDSFQISVSAEQAPEDPKVFTKIELTYRFKGDALSKDSIDKTINLVLDKYCSVAVMIKQAATLTYRLVLDSR
jgi:putative redox protein